MPKGPRWTEPEIFLAYKGVTIYRAYENDQRDEPILDMFSTTQKDKEDHGHCVFLVGNLPTWDSSCNLTEKVVKTAIEKAIDQGLLKQNEPIPRKF